MSPSNRRQFIKAGGIFIAASGLAATVNAFAKEEEKQNEEVSPPEDLMREHGVLKRILLIYMEAIRRIEADQDLYEGGLRKRQFLARSLRTQTVFESVAVGQAHISDSNFVRGRLYSAARESVGGGGPARS